MKKLILFTVIIINCIQLSVAQKIYLSYKINTVDSLFEFREKAFSNTDIQTKTSTIFQKYVYNKEILSIEDNIKRKFILFEYNHEEIYLNQLNAGYYSLYEYRKDNDLRFYVISKNDTITLEKPDSARKQDGKKNFNHFIKLTRLAKDYPELWEKAQKVEFKSQDIQSFICELNSKFTGPNLIYNSNSRYNYLNISLKGFILEDKTDLMLDVLKSQYFIGHSTNVSLRYGIKANYYQLTEFFPESWTGWYTIQNGQKDSIFNYRNHYETLTAEIFELPFSVNFEITNSLVTPYLNTGLAPTLYYRTINRTDSEQIDKMTKVTFNVFAAAGVKLKLTDNFNIMSEYRWDLIKGLNFLIGLEYYFHPHKHL